MIHNSQPLNERLRELRKKAGYSQQQMARKLHLTQGAISQWENGITVPAADQLSTLADVFEITVDELLGRDTLGVLGILPVNPRAVPILGDIACGVPITAEQNIEGYADLPEGVRADFALRCKGDSMEPTFIDGDLVLIRQEGDVSDGRIAAVLLDSETDTEATLKRIHHVPGGLILIPDNQKKYGPQTFQGSEAAKIRILGVAVGYVRMI